MTSQVNEPPVIPIEQFGRDHWSLLAYIEHLCVDKKGVPDLHRMRCNPRRHPGLAMPMPSGLGDGVNEDGSDKYPTIIKNNEKVQWHDDHDCADDLEAAGLIVVSGTGINPVYSMTPLGQRIASRLRIHKQNGGCFSDVPVTVELQA